MKLYRLTIELCSALVTPLKGDTIWGHIVWGIANNEGEDAVQKFMETENGAPQLINSSAFPHGLICKPYPEPEQRGSAPTKSEYSKRKKDKKQKYISASEYISDIKESGGESDEPFKSVEVMHNSINRLSGTVEDHSLFAVQEHWARCKLWDIYVLSIYEKDRTKTLFKWAFENGFGADSSSGKGKIAVKSIKEVHVLKSGGDKYMALAPFVPDSKQDIKNLRANIFVRRGKLGGAFVSKLPPYKKTVILYDEGAVFSSGTAMEWVGLMLENMHGTTEYNIRQAGFAPVIPV